MPDIQLLENYFKWDLFYKFLLESSIFKNRENTIKWIYLKWLKNSPIELELLTKFTKDYGAGNII